MFLDIIHTYRGSTSDITIFRNSDFGQHVVEGTTIAADAIYQGLASELNGESIMIPHRRDDVDFSQVSQRHNSFLSSFRAMIEHSFGQLKNFEIISFYRGDLWKFNSIFISAAPSSTFEGVLHCKIRDHKTVTPHTSVLEQLKIPYQDCMLLYLKWLKWNECMKSLTLSFGCGKYNSRYPEQTHGTTSPLLG